MSIDNINNPFRAVVNNVGPNPFQGFDVEVWATDLATGAVLDIGQFQSCTYTIRNATETYLTLGQRIPTYHDGEIQIAWVLERGKLNVDNIGIWLGTNDINRDRYLGRSPRFQITIDYNAPELQGAGINTNTYVVESGPVKPRAGIFDPSAQAKLGYLNASGTSTSPSAPLINAKGRIHLVRCKLDSKSEGIMPGRRIIADRLEGVSEGLFVDMNGSLQDTLKKEARNVANRNRFGGANAGLNVGINNTNPTTR